MPATGQPTIRRNGNSQRQAEGLDETHFRALRELARDGNLSQRDLAGKMGLSLGRVNYVIRSLINSGMVKARRFRNSHHKIAYMYVLTPAGLRKKAQATGSFLRAKSEEYEALRREIEELRGELESEPESLDERTAS